jgi:hypothetical protein
MSVICNVHTDIMSASLVDRLKWNMSKDIAVLGVSKCNAYSFHSKL